MKKVSLQYQYDYAAEVIKTAILQSQYEAAKDINRIQLGLYFGIGKFLSEKTRNAKWGTNALQSISDKLKSDLPGLRGFSATNLKKMRTFYDNWKSIDYNSSVATDEISPVATGEIEDVQKECDMIIRLENNAIKIDDIGSFPIEDFFKIPFSHHMLVVEKVKEIEARYYYINRTAEEHLSVEQLKKIIKNNDFENRASMPNNFPKTISNSSLARKAVMMFKDEYLLDFINVEEIGERDKNCIDERVVEKQIIENVKRFIMTFGKDFAFVGNQYHLEVYGESFFPDLLFFNRNLNVLVVFELKIGDFKPIYLSQLMTYLRILDDKVRKSHENPSIGIVLCKNANKDFVKYVIQDYDKPMGVATFDASSEMPEELRKALPDVDDLKKLL
jgi:predicted nuclease of restriction endonuclease-like (RecB) superfamily